MKQVLKPNTKRIALFYITDTLYIKIHQMRDPVNSTALHVSQGPDRLQQTHRGAQLEPENAGEVRLAEQGQRGSLQGVLAENLQENVECHIRILFSRTLKRRKRRSGSGWVG